MERVVKHGHAIILCPRRSILCFTLQLLSIDEVIIRAEWGLPMSPFVDLAGMWKTSASFQKAQIGSFTKGCHIVLWFGPKLNEWPKQFKFVVGMLFVDTLLFAWQLILFIYRFWEVRIVNGQSPTFQQFNLTRDSRCLHKRINCEGENAMNCIVARKRLFLDGLTPEIEAETPD